MSKRFALKRFLGLSESEMLENERMWREENNVPHNDEGAMGSDLRGVGVSPGGMDADLEAMNDFEAELDGDEGDMGDLDTDTDTDNDVDLP
jgi:hypothetical protein